MSKPVRPLPTGTSSMSRPVTAGATRSVPTVASSTARPTTRGGPKHPQMAASPSKRPTTKGGFRPPQTATLSAKRPTSRGGHRTPLTAASTNRLPTNSTTKPLPPSASSPIPGASASLNFSDGSPITANTTMNRTQPNQRLAEAREARTKMKDNARLADTYAVLDCVENHLAEEARAKKTAAHKRKMASLNKNIETVSSEVKKLEERCEALPLLFEAQANIELRKSLLSENENFPLSADELNKWQQVEQPLLLEDISAETTEILDSLADLVEQLKQSEPIVEIQSLSTMKALIQEAEALLEKREHLEAEREGLSRHRASLQLSIALVGERKAG